MSLNYDVGDLNKLIGVLNHNIWRIKMTLILERKDMWPLKEAKQVLALFLAFIGRTSYTNIKIKEAK